LRASPRSDYHTGMDNPVLLTAEQRRAVSTGPEPLRLLDPDSREEFVLVRADVYERVRQLLDDAHPRDAYPAIDRAFAEGWGDPKMDDYDRYDELRK
jgi:hypothetical protein